MTRRHQHTHRHGAGGHHPGHGRGGRHEHSDGGQAGILDLDAEVPAGRTAPITARLPLKSGPRQIVDPGCGTGAGTFALPDRSPAPHVTAVDTSAGHLRLLREKACARGVEDLAALDELLDTGGPNSLLHREGLSVRTERTLWAARRA